MPSPQPEAGLQRAMADPACDGRNPVLLSTAQGAQGSAASTTSPLAAGWSSAQLLAGRRETEISHAGAVYRLRLTALGKLILTK